MQLELHVADTAELVRRYYPNGQWGGLTLDGACLAALGDRVSLHVVVSRPRCEVTLDGKVGWARRKATRDLGLGFGVDVLDTSGIAWEKLLAFARNELSADALRASARIEVAVPVRLSWADQVRRELMIDLSSGGAFVRTHEPIPLGATVGLSVRAPGSIFATQLTGRVAWARQTGSAPGVGIQFMALTPAVQRSVEKLLSHAAAR